MSLNFSVCMFKMNLKFPLGQDLSEVDFGLKPLKYLVTCCLINDPAYFQLGEDLKKFVRNVNNSKSGIITFNGLSDLIETNMN